MINYIRNKKGFTLVEIIVVLVIIAILAATTLPALTGYINDAKEKTAISEGRTVLVAAQTIASQMNGDGKTAAEILTQVTKVTASGATDKYSTVNELTGMNLAAGDVSLVESNTSGKITRFVLVASNKKFVEYTSNGTTSGFEIKDTKPTT